MRCLRRYSSLLSRTATTAHYCSLRRRHSLLPSAHTVPVCSPSVLLHDAAVEIPAAVAVKIPTADSTFFPPYPSRRDPNVPLPVFLPITFCVARRPPHA